MPYDHRFRSLVVNAFVAALWVMLARDVSGAVVGDGYVEGIHIMLFVLLILFLVSDGAATFGDPDSTVQYVAGLVALAVGLGVMSFDLAPRPTGTVLLVVGAAVHPTVRGEFLREAENWETRLRRLRRTTA